MPRSPKPVRHDIHGPPPVPIGELERWGTTDQKKYFRRRVKRDLIYLLHEAHNQRKTLSSEDIDALPESVRDYLATLEWIHDHVPWALSGLVTRPAQWAELEAQLPSDDTQETLPFK